MHKTEDAMHKTTVRRVLIALGSAMAIIAMTAGQALATGGPGPFPK